MALNVNALGHITRPHALAYDWKTLATYALGVGAKKDELAFLYENTEGGMKTFPTFAVVPSHAPVLDCLIHTEGDLAMVVHGGQTVRLHPAFSDRTLPATGTIMSVGEIKGIYDMKKFAQVVIETRSTLDDVPLFDTVWSIIIRGAGGFSGPRPPENDAPSVPKDRAEDFVVEEPTTPEQALLYRISGDQNPLHADPRFAESVGFPQGPILHGLCTFGFMGRAVLHRACDSNPAKLKALGCQFRKPVWPGETLITKGYRLDDGRYALATFVKDKPDAVLTSAWAQIS
jgi:acyl dehydratase